MVLDEVLERFTQPSPVALMARAALKHALSHLATDALSGQVAERQSTRTLPFSSVVVLMGAVVARTHPAVNAASRARAETIGVSTRASL